MMVVRVNEEGKKTSNASTFKGGKSEARSAIERGQKRGVQTAQRYYGQAPRQTAQDVQKIIEARRQGLNQASPQSTALRQSTNQQIMQARAQGAAGGRDTSAMEAQLRRGGEVQAAQADYENQLRNLGLFQRTIGNVLSGQAGMEQGQQQLELAGVKPNVPAPSSSPVGTVVCTELCRQGYMSPEVRKKDLSYGMEVLRTRPEVYYGYLFLATPVVKLMRKSPVFTKLISIPALAWAQNMAGQKNMTGKIISRIGEPVCGFVGKILSLAKGVSYAKRT
jgi:hypothetical protein